MKLIPVIITIVLLAAVTSTHAAENLQDPTVSGFQILADSEPFEGETRHEYTFVANCEVPRGQSYYELSFFNAEGVFLGYANGTPDLSLGRARCNGTAYLTGIASTYEFSWQSYGESATPRSALVSELKVSDFQWNHDPEPFDGEFRYEYTCMIAGPSELQGLYYEVAFLDAEGAFLGFSNGFVDLTSGSARSNGIAYLRGIADLTDFSWQ